MLLLLAEYFVVVILLLTVLLCLRYAWLRRWMARTGQTFAPKLPPGLGAADVEGLLEARDAQQAPLMPKAGSAVLWAKGKRNEQADLCVLFIHGWSASCQECSPVDERIAEGLGAHLMRFRLPGHGVSPHERGGFSMRDTATREALFQDAGTALALASLLGKRVIVLGCSTGGTLALWLAVQPWAQPHISGVLLISAALRLNKPTPQLYVRVRWAHLLLPKALATPLLNLIVGSVYRIPYRNARQAECWTLVYPAAAAINAIGVFVTAETVVDPAAIVAPVLSWHNPGDPTANYEYTKQFVARVPVNRWETVTDSELQHNITGDIQSPSTVDRIVTQGLEFLRTNGCDVVPCGPTSVGPEPAVTRRNGASPKKKR